MSSSRYSIWLVNISYSTMPVEKMSERWSMRSPQACSGLM
jgi:hypothetical protein